jgi:uronate dehydrogenase
MPTRKVVVTGAAGLIGSILRTRLAGPYELTAFDRRRSSGIGRADMRSLKSARRAFRGADVVVDLAAASDVDLSWSDAYDNNIRATINAFEAARLEGVARVVFASSNHVVGGYEDDEPYASIVRGRYDGLDPAAVPRLGVDAPLRPDGAYAVAKALGEAAGRYYADTHGLSVVCLRIGSATRTGRPENAREFATLLTHDDLVRLVTAAIEAPADVRYAVVYGVSRNTWRFWDVDAAASIGYEPLDDAERWRP